LLNFSGSRTLPVYLQAELGECGLACLAMIATYHGHSIDIATLRRKFPASLKGTNLELLSSYALQLKLSPRPLRLELEELSLLHLPCILHWDLNHFVVLKKVDQHHAWIHDPAFGASEISLSKLSDHFTGVALELMPSQDFQKKDEKQSIPLKTFWQRIVGLKTALVQLFVLSLCLQVFSLLSPFYMQLVVDEAILNQDTSLLQLLALGFGMLGLISIAVTTVRAWVSTVISTQMSFQLSGNIFRHLLMLPAMFFSRRHVGDIVSRFGSLNPINQLLTGGIIEGLLDGLMAVATLALMYMYNPLLSNLVLVSIIIYMVIRLISFPRFRELREEGLVSDAKENTLFIETLRSIPVLKNYNKEQDRHVLWHNQLAEVLNNAIRTRRMGIGFSTVYAILRLVENTLVIYLAATQVMAGTFTIGMLFAFISYKANFSGAISRLIEQFINLKMIGLHLERLADIALEEPEILHQDFDLDDESSTAPPQQAGTLEMRNIAYRWSSSDPWVIRDFSMAIAPGEIVAITGPSGCGKSTLLRILMGLMRQESGDILVDGTPLTVSGLTRYRSKLGVVMQEDQLLSGSIRDNISLFSSNIDAKLIERAAKMAFIHDEIMQMPMGYNTLVGAIGSGLSGGQVQRVCLARAFYHQPRFLFLDEATSQLDVPAEANIMKIIRKLGITCVFIAHRPETIKYADRIIQL